MLLARSLARGLRATTLDGRGLDDAGESTPAGERTARVLAGYRRTARDRGWARRGALLERHVGAGSSASTTAEGRRSPDEQDGRRVRKAGTLTQEVSRTMSS